MIERAPGGSRQTRNYKGRLLGKASAVAGLLTGALVWGLIWYPFRLLEAAGVRGTVATLATYAVALVAACIVFRRDLGALRRPDRLLVLIALSAGWTNLGYVLGMIHGQVMQVLLLFYLAPLWTVGVRCPAAGRASGPRGLSGHPPVPGWERPSCCGNRE